MEEMKQPEEEGGKGKGEHKEGLDPLFKILVFRLEDLNMKGNFGLSESDIISISRSINEAFNRNYKDKDGLIREMAFTNIITFVNRIAISKEVLHLLEEKKMADIFVKQTNDVIMLARSVGRESSALALTTLYNPLILDQFEKNPSKVIDTFGGIAKVAGEDAWKVFISLRSREGGKLFLDCINGKITIKDLVSKLR